MMGNSGAETNGKILVHVDPLFMEITPKFLENRRKDVESMLESLEQDDYEEIRVLGHSMKGHGTSYGFEAITNLGGAIEQAAQERNSEGIRKMVDELSTYLERVEVVYE